MDAVPGVSYLTGYYSKLMDWAVGIANAKFFHVRQVLVPLNGSGDTSYGWAQLWLQLSVAIIGCIAWSVADSKRSNYTHLNYWLCLFARYYLALCACVYGILKIFALQMYFPGLHQLATPLGDYLPMRFSWLFIGYSSPYQVFSGIMETVAGLLLLYRKTSTGGALLATAVFVNVMMLNLAYDIPVKIFSMELVFVCLFLLANERNRIGSFLILNKPAAACDLYHFPNTKKWMRITRVIVKIVFIIIALVLPLVSDIEYYQSTQKPVSKQPVKNGFYEVTAFAINKDTLPLRLSDSLRWQDVIFENGLGSIKTSDTAFRQRYQRAYFTYSLDSTSQTLVFRKHPADSVPILNLHFDMPDSNTVRLRGRQRNDSLYVVLQRMNRHFQLAEKQFHWLSEYNR